MSSPSAGPVARSSVTRVGVATALSALCGFVVMYLAARALEPAGFSLFGVFWGAFGLVTGAANGLLQQSTREVRLALGGVASPSPLAPPSPLEPPSPPEGKGVSARPALSDKSTTSDDLAVECASRSTNPPILRSAGTLDAGPGVVTHPMRMAVGIGLVAAAALVLSALWWGPHVFISQTRLSVLLLAVGLACFCLHATLLGMLAGDNRWGQYGALMVTDAGIRVAVAVTSMIVGWGLGGFLWATVAGSVAWLLMLLLSPTTRHAAGLVARERPSSFLRGAGHAVAAAGASAVLVMGFPVLLQATSGELGAAGGVLILAVTATRAPLLVPLTAMQGNLIAHFVDSRGHRLRALAKPVALIGSIGAVGVVLAYFFGPWLLRVGFGAEYIASGALLSVLTVGAVSMAVLTITGAATVAAALHRAYSLGWVGATVAATGLLLLPLELEQRTAIALIFGPLVGISVHLSALSRA
ncbi:hypothetical protein [Mycolicibacterium brumae]|uniref:hypothetical protein n=1 Tax=Mycolicibacterium brumae TaxID=85968 RepID=UPI000AC5EE4B|nr:hypothetical protein [Mycolicibacterium brumae]UWW07319.1 hypothetical protein L2Z93_000324 [Mycolicibacterium brumae]